MASKKEFTFLSRDGKTKVHAVRWTPDGEIRGVFQIVHGMQEYINRYERFANFMCEQGFIVTGEDHLGHGETAPSDEELGYFAKNDPETIVVRDVHRLKKMTQEEYPNLPYFLLGHSMGSFIARKYLCMYGSGITGAIIMGTGVMPGIVTGVGKFLCNVISLFKGQHGKSKFITNIAFGSYQKKIENPRTEKDWLTRDPEIVDKYLADKFCMFDFSLNGYHTLFSLLSYVCKVKNLHTIPETLPIFVCAGGADPVGNYGEGPAKVADTYKKLGIQDVTLRIYDGMRHEVLNEIGHEEVDQDILNFVNAHL